MEFNIFYPRATDFFSKQKRFHSHQNKKYLLPWAELMAARIMLDSTSRHIVAVCILAATSRTWISPSSKKQQMQDLRLRSLSGLTDL